MLIPTAKNVKTITDLRENALEILNTIKKERITFIFHRSRPKAVMIDVDQFIEIQEMLEDYFDIIEAKKLKKTPIKKLISLEDVAKEYGLQNLLYKRSKKRT